MGGPAPGWLTQCVEPIEQRRRLTEQSDTEPAGTIPERVCDVGDRQVRRGDADREGGMAGVGRSIEARHALPDLVSTSEREVRGLSARRRPSRPHAAIRSVTRARSPRAVHPGSAASGRARLRTHPRARRTAPRRAPHPDRGRSPRGSAHRPGRRIGSGPSRSPGRPRHPASDQPLLRSNPARRRPSGLVAECARSRRPGPPAGPPAGPGSWPQCTRAALRTRQSRHNLSCSVLLAPSLSESWFRLAFSPRSDR